MSAQGKEANKVNIEFDILSEDPVLTEEELKADIFTGQVWFPQMSGIVVKENLVEILEKQWILKTGNLIETNVFELSNSYSEGKRVLKKSYSYERNPEAREACLAHYGYICYVCGFSFVKKYGKVGEKFIHVHHKIPVSEVGHEYIVDPLKDLVPICPNCHAMIHRKVPAMSVDELKIIVQYK